MLFKSSFSQYYITISRSQINPDLANVFGFVCGDKIMISKITQDSEGVTDDEVIKRWVAFLLEVLNKAL